MLSVVIIIVEIGFRYDLKMNRERDDNSKQCIYTHSNDCGNTMMTGHMWIRTECKSLSFPNIDICMTYSIINIKNDSKTILPIRAYFIENQSNF